MFVFVVTNGQQFSLYPVTAGLPQGGVWSPAGVVQFASTPSSISAQFLFLDEFG